jgi:hypothetical protein
VVPRSRRRVGALVATTAAACLLLSTAGAAIADTTTTDPGVAAAAWLPTELTDGDRMVVEFEGADPFVDTGLTIDVLFALASAGVGADTIADIAAWLEGETTTYSGADGSFSAGGTAKLLLAVAVLGDDPTDVDGVDLIERLGTLEDDEGRFRDVGRDDFSNVVTQSLAILALTRAGDGASDAAVTVLTDAACDDGGYPTFFAEEPCAGAADATAYAAQALLAAGDQAGAQAATDWLATTAQDPDTGAFDDGFSGLNANSTGLAAVALGAAGPEDAHEAAVGFLLDLQFGCDAPPEQVGAIRLTPADETGDARATAQAVLGLTGADLLTLSADDASPDLPLLDCEAAGDGQEEPAPTDETEELGDAQTEAAVDDDAATEATDDLDADDQRVDAGTEAAAAADDTGSGVLFWVLGAVLIAAAAAWALLRRRGSTS